MTKLTKTHGYLALAGLTLLAGFRTPGADERTASAAAAATPRVAAAPAATALAAPAPERAENAREAEVRSALDALAAAVMRQSHPEALKLAFTAYYNFKAAYPEQVRKPYFYYVDYGLDNRTPRGYVFDMAQLKLVEGPFLVSHGRGSAGAADGVPVRFTNRPGSAATSLGLYVAEETYRFSGKSAGRYYTSIGLRLDGVSEQFNSTARARGVVVHGAPYVTNTRAGRSEGCPAMDQSRARRLIPLIAKGGLVFHFSPHDEEWMAADPWVR